MVLGLGPQLRQYDEIDCALPMKSEDSQRDVQTDEGNLSVEAPPHTA